MTGMTFPGEAARPGGPRQEGDLNEIFGSSKIENTVSPTDEKASEVQVERSEGPVWNEEDEVPELHLRTWIALGAMLILQFVQLLALQGPPAVVSAAKYFYGPNLLSVLIPLTLPRTLAIIHWNQSSQQQGPGMDQQLVDPGPGRPGPHNRFDLRYLPSPQASPPRCLYIVVHRMCHCPGFEQPLSPCWGTDLDWFRLLGCPSGICDSQ